MCILFIIRESATLSIIIISIRLIAYVWIDSKSSFNSLYRNFKSIHGKTYSMCFSNKQRVPACYFSGHSHWATIKHDKADKDIKRSNLYAKLSKSISCAVQQGGPDPST